MISESRPVIVAVQKTQVIVEDGHLRLAAARKHGHAIKVIDTRTQRTGTMQPDGTIILTEAPDESD